MENMNPAIEAKKNFEKELNSLHQKLDEKLIRLDASTRTKGADNSAPESTIEELNQVKIHRMKIRAAWNWLRSASQQDWRDRKNSLKAKFEDAAKLV